MNIIDNPCYTMAAFTAYSLKYKRFTVGYRLIADYFCRTSTVTTPYIV